jgi:hypothetical protein
MHADIVTGHRMEDLQLGPPVLKLSFANIRSDILSYKFTAQSSCKLPVTIRQSHSQSIQEKYWTFTQPDIEIDVHMFLHLHTPYEVRGRGLVLDFYAVETCTIYTPVLKVDYLSSLSSLIRRYLPSLIVFSAGIELIQPRRPSQMILGVLYATIVRYGITFLGYSGDIMLLGHYSASIAYDYITLVVLLGVAYCMLDLYYYLAVLLSNAGAMIMHPIKYFGDWSFLRPVIYTAFLIGTFIGLPNHLVVLVSFLDLWARHKAPLMWKMFLLHLILLAITIPQLLPWIQGIPVVGVFSWKIDRNPIFTVPFLVFGCVRSDGDGRSVGIATLCKVAGWILIIFGIRMPHLLESVVWLIVTALAAKVIRNK